MSTERRKKDREKVRREKCTYSGVRSQLDQETFALEAELSDLGPVEGVNFCVPLNKRRRDEEKMVNIHEKETLKTQ